VLHDVEVTDCRSLRQLLHRHKIAIRPIKRGSNARYVPRCDRGVTANLATNAIERPRLRFGIRQRHGQLHWTTAML
jgi:hypothetical protein